MNDETLIGNGGGVMPVLSEKIMSKFSPELAETLNFVTFNLTKELPTLSIDLDYFILGVFTEKQSDLYARLNDCMLSSTLSDIYNAWYESVSSRAMSALKTNRTPVLAPDMVEYITRAEKEAEECNSDEITTEHVFLSILGDEKNNKVKRLFNKSGITYGIMKSKISEGKPESYDGEEEELSFINDEDVDGIPLGGPEIKLVRFNSMEEAKRYTEKLKKQLKERSGIIPTEKKNGFIAKYCENLNDLAKEGKLDPLVGREKEISEVTRILSRRRKNNVILLGGEGVGKTAIAESFASKIVSGDVPEFLNGKEVVSLDMTALVAGTTLRGMFEERVKGILNEIKENPKYILFIDNIGSTLADKGKNDFELASMLARSLENGEVQVIGTSDFASYRKTFDKDPSLARRFQKVTIEAPSIDESINILNGIKESYQKYHNVVYTQDAIEACVKLANRYITERNLPDSAIDLLDETGAFIGVIQEPESFKTDRHDMSVLKTKIEKLKANNNYEEADEYEKELRALTKRYNENLEEFKKMKELGPSLITKEHILDMVSRKTNIPVNNLTADDKSKLLMMNERIKEGVIGQDEAIDKICRALKRNRVGLHKNGCMYSALTIGRTGVGKTLIAKKLAKELFGSEDSLVRFDMSEYSDKVSVNKLIGSNPGYVGYEDGGQLTEAIKRHKHCVLLLDEIEKADPEVYNIFLQVLDEGFLTDNSGMKVDFKNVIVLFTSNVGAKMASDFGKGIGFNEDEEENSKRILLKQLKNRFPPEFLNRIDDVIYFNSLTDDNLKKIIELEIGKMEEKLNSIGYSIILGDGVVDFIFDIVKTEKEYGARPIMRAIQENIEDKITDFILEHDCHAGQSFKLAYNEQEKQVAVS